MIEIKNIYKTYQQGQTLIPVLKNITFSIKKAETLAITGPSGCGKTTLLSILAGLESPDKGEVWVKNQNLATMNESDRTLFRSQNIGMVFQQFHLVPHLSALENVCLPVEIQSTQLSFLEISKKAQATLDQVGLGHRFHHLPKQLSGGEQQRVAIARACIHQPAIILADEPSGNLDNDSSKQVMDLLFSMVQKNHSTLILVTHDSRLAERCQKRFSLIEKNK